MAEYKQLREIQSTYLAASRNKTHWKHDALLRTNALAEQVSILAGHLADQMIPIASPPPCDDEYVATGCSLFSDPSRIRSVTPTPALPPRMA